MFIAGKLFCQDTLPRFSLTERGDRVTISWTNPYQTLIQLNVQRSYDSLRNFSTVFSAPSPELPQNGYTDVKPAINKIYYRIFYVLQGGSYFFSKSQRAGTATAATGVVSKDLVNSRDLVNSNIDKLIPGDQRVITVKIKDVIFKQLSVNAFRNFRDSILHLTRDTLYSINDSLVGLNPYLMREAFKPSQYIYVSRDGYINVSLPAINERKYSLKFFEEDGTSLFEIHNVKESPLVLDKASFIHSGWFVFELYEDNKLKEKNKFYVPKDF
jgi:hypothetical protein